MHYWGGGWYHMGWMSIWWLCGVAAIAVLIWYGVASARRGGALDSPESILKRRYAGGEIDHDEYVRKLEELRR